LATEIFKISAVFQMSFLCNYQSVVIRSGVFTHG